MIQLLHSSVLFDDIVSSDVPNYSHNYVYYSRMYQYPVHLLHVALLYFIIHTESLYRVSASASVSRRL